MNLAGQPARFRTPRLPARSISSAMTAAVRVASDVTRPSRPLLQIVCHHIARWDKFVFLASKPIARNWNRS
jgi:hypothetical protein